MHAALEAQAQSHPVREFFTSVVARLMLTDIISV